jgi:hypothetical protein
MARTFPRRWMFLPIALIASLASGGYERGYSDGEMPEVTLRDGGGGGRLWQCPACERVERVLLDAPVCFGEPDTRGGQHPGTPAKPVPRSKIGRLGPTDERFLFREAD